MSLAAIPTFAGAFAFAIMGNVFGSFTVTAAALPLAWIGLGIAWWSA